MKKPHLRGLFWHPSYWVQNYKIATESKTKFAEKHFSKISNMLRAEAGQMKPKKQANDWILHATAQNPMLSNWKDWLGNTCPSCILIVTLKTFRQNSICTAFKKNRNLKEILSPSLHTRYQNKK